MRLSTMALGVLLLCPPPLLACWKDEPEQTAWLNNTPSYYRGVAEDNTEARTIALSLAGAGLASVGLIAVSFRMFSRTTARASI